MMITTIFVRNPFDPSSREIQQHEYVAVKTVNGYVERYFSEWPDTKFNVRINGRKIEKSEYETIFPCNGDQIVMGPVVGKGLGGIFRSVLTMALMAYAGGLSVGRSWFVNALVKGATMYVGGRIINAILPPPIVNNVNNSSNSTSSPTYGWDGAQSVTQQGTPVGKTFGTVKPAPVLLSRHISTDGDKQYLNMLWSGGEGPVDFVDTVTIEGNPAENYSGTQVDIRLGTNDQDPIPNFANQWADQSLGYELVTGGTWSIHQTEGNAGQGLEVTFESPNGLYYAKDDGSLGDASVTVKAQYRAEGNADWLDWAEWTITAAQNTAVRRAFRIDNLAAARYEVRCTCTNKSGTSNRYSTRVYWKQLTHITYDDLCRPNKVLVGIRSLATDQLSGSDPKVDWRQGRSQVNVWNPDTGQYEQKRASNPYWASYDLIHDCKRLMNINTGQYEYMVEGNPVNRIDYPMFKENADYSDELDEDGDYRFEFNYFLDTNISFWDALSRITQVGRGIIIPKGTKYSCICDKPGPVTQLFTMGNIAKGSLKGKFQSAKDRALAVEVDFFNEEKDYKQDPAVYYDEEWEKSDRIANPTTLTYYGVTKYKQAYKEAAFRYRCNKYLKRTENWEADIDAIACQVGEVVDLQHDVPRWGDAGGRIVLATANTVMLDQSVTLVPGVTYMVEIRLITDVIVKRYVQAVEAETTTDTLTVTESFNPVPERYDVFAFGESTRVTKPFKVTNITASKEQKCKLVGVEYVEAIYDDNIDVPIVQYSTLDSSLPEVQGLSVNQETYRENDGTVVSVINCSWALPRLKAIQHVNVYYSSDNGQTWMIWSNQINTSAKITGAKTLETYLIKVCTVNAVGVPSPGVISEPVYITGRDNPPPDVYTLMVEKLSSGAYRFSFALADNSPSDLAGYRLKYNIGNSQWWQTAIPLHDGLVLSSPYETNSVPRGALTVLIKAVDNAGNESDNAAYAIVGLGDTLVDNVLWTQDFVANQFPGLPDQTVFVSPGMIIEGGLANCHIENGYLVADDSGDMMYPLDVNDPMYPADLNQQFYRANWPAMIYEDTFIPDQSGMLSFNYDIDGNAQVYYREQYPYQMYGREYDPFYPEDMEQLLYKEGPWLQYRGKVEIVADIYQMRVEIAAGTVRGTIRELAAVVDVPDLPVETFNDITIPATGLRLPITQKYIRIKNVSATIQDAGDSTAMAVKIVDKNPINGPLLIPYDKNKNPVIAVIDAAIQGY